MATTMACSTPTTMTSRPVSTAMTNSSRRIGVDGAQALEVDQLDADEEHDRGEHGGGHVLQRLGEEEQHDEHDPGRGQAGDLAAAAGPVDHLGLGRAAVDDERARQAGARVGEAEADEVDVLVERLLVLRGVGPRGRRALGEHDDEDGAAGADQRRELRPGDRREAEVGQAARHRAERRDAVGREVQLGADDDGAHDGDEGAGDAWGDRLGPEDHHDHGHADQDRRAVARREVAQRRHELLDGAARLLRGCRTCRRPAPSPPGCRRR